MMAVLPRGDHLRYSHRATVAAKLRGDSGRGRRAAATSTGLADPMDDAGERARLGPAAGALYSQTFDIERTIAALREDCRPGGIGS